MDDEIRIIGRRFRPGQISHMEGMDVIQELSDSFSSESPAFTLISEIMLYEVFPIEPSEERFVIISMSIV